MGKIVRLAGETALYGLGSILPRFINFLLVRLHTDVFDPEAYGVITKLFAFTALINIVLSFGMETAFFRFATKPGADKRHIFNLSQTVVAGISIFFLLISVLFSSSFAVLLSIPGRSDYVIWLAGIMFIDAVVSIPFARLRLEKKPLTFAIGRLTNIGILVGLNLYFLKVIYNPAIGVEYVIAANLIANVFYLLFFFKWLVAWRPRWDAQVSPQMLSYAYPVMLTGLPGMVNEMFSRLMLEAWLPENFYPGKSNKYALGVFGACYKFAVLMNLCIQAFRYAAEPFFFSNSNDKNSPSLFARVNHYFVIVCCFLMLTVSINMDILKHFLKNPLYWEGLEIVPILLLAYLFLGVYYNLSIWYKLTDRTYVGTFITIGGAIITVVGNYFLIPLLGYYGSSLATLMCYSAMMVACYLLGQRYYPIPYRTFSDLSYIIVTTALIYGVSQISIANQWAAFSFHILVILLAGIVVYFAERDSIRNLLTRQAG